MECGVDINFETQNNWLEHDLSLEIGIGIMPNIFLRSSCSRFILDVGWICRRRNGSILDLCIIKNTNMKTFKNTYNIK